MADDHEGASPVARRWLRTLRIVRRRVQDSVPPPSRYLLVVTPTDPTSDLPMHLESGGEEDGDHWVLLDKGGEVVRRRGVHAHWLACTTSTSSIRSWRRWRGFGWTARGGS